MATIRNKRIPYYDVYLGFMWEKLCDESFDDHSSAGGGELELSLPQANEEKMVISTTSNKPLLTIKWKTKNIILSEQFRNPIKQNRKKQAHRYIISYFSVLTKALQSNVAGLN